MENIMKQFPKKVIMSDRHMPDGQLYSFLQIFFNTEKISLRLDITVTDYVLLIFIGIPL